MRGGEEGREREAVDSGRPSSPTPKIQTTKKEEKMTKLEMVMQKEQLVSQ